MKNNDKKNKAFCGFTLSEVLIALTVIGVVAALTIGYIFPAVKKVKLQNNIHHFYSTVNQAMYRSYLYNGQHSELPLENFTYAQNVDWLENNILNSMNYLSYKNCNDPNQYRRNAVCVQMMKGDMFEFVASTDGADFLYFPDGNWYNIETKSTNVTSKIFAFQFSKRVKANSSQLLSKFFIEPYSFNWNGVRSDLFNNSERGCKKGKKKFYCTKIIQLNNWVIPDDYPW